MVTKFVLNETSYFGKGSRNVLPDEISKRGFKRVLLVSDKSLVEAGVTKNVMDVLDSANIKYTLYDEVKPNPTIKNVMDGVKACKKCKADVIIAVGGGSSIDTAKGISIVMTNPDRTLQSLNGLSNTINKGMPVIALPTTHGTAAEVTINYVITDEEKEIKMVCVDPNDIPVLAIIDADLMATMPKSIAAATGMDALTHAIEGYITKAHNTMSDMFHLRAIQLIFKYLPSAVNDKNEEAIEMMGLAQYIAGMGFSNVGLGIVHSMAHALGAVYDTPHGVANAILLPTVMEYNADATGDKYKYIAKAMGVEGVEDMTQEEYRKAAVDAVKKLSADVGIPADLKEIVKEEDVQFLAESAFADACAPGNPKDASVEDIVALYKSLL